MFIWFVIAVDDVGFRDNEASTVKDLQQQFSNRPVWMAASIHRGEEEGKRSGNAPLLFHGYAKCIIHAHKSNHFVTYHQCKGQS
jgi:hypothetical protein